MIVIKVTYQRTKQVGRYEPERIGFEVVLEEGDDVLEAVERARATARRAFGELPNEEDVQFAREILKSTEYTGF